MYKTQHIIAINQLDVFNKIVNFMLSVGWELLDDISATNKVFRSKGEDNNLIKYMYSRLYISGERIYVMHYGFWDELSHQGFHALHTESNGTLFYKSYTAENTLYNHVECFFAGSKDYIMCLFIRYDNSAVYYDDGGGFGCIPKPLNRLIRTSLTSVSSGTNVIVTLDSVDKLKLNTYYKIFDKDFKLGSERVKIIAINVSNNSVTIESITNNYPNGIYIGHNIISLFVYSTDGGHLNQLYPADSSGTDTAVTYYHNLSILYRNNNDLSLPNNSYPMVSEPRHLLNRNLFRDSYTGLFVGYFDENISSCIYAVNKALGKSVLCCNNDGSHTLNNRSYFTNINADFNILTDTRKNWTVDELKDKYVVFISGAGAGQSRRILSNTSNQITVLNNFIINIDRTSQYIVVDSVHRFMTIQSTTYYPGSFVYKDTF